MRDINNIEIKIEDLHWAAGNGHLEVLQYIYTIFENLSLHNEKEGRQNEIFADDSYAFRVAAENGHLKVLQWLYPIFEKLGRQDEIFAYDSWAFRWAARNGHLDVLQWLYPIFEKLGRPEEIFADDSYAFIRQFKRMKN